MSTTRLRKTFHYPSSSSDEDTLEQGMDEKDQTELLSQLIAHDTSTTNTYTVLFCALPLALALAHFPLLIRFATLPSNLAAILSFVASAYILYFLPLGPSSISINQEEDTEKKRRKKKKKGIETGCISRSAFHVPVQERREVPYMSVHVAEIVAEYILRCNAVVCVVLAMLEFFSSDRAWSEGMFVGGGFLPGFVLGVVLWARKELRVVDMTELEKLKFPSKTF